jgi:CMP-N-acetylneuraminic acid synthetase
MRPEYLGTDSTTSIAVTHHTIEYLQKNEEILESDYILLLQPTSPLRIEKDITDVVDIAISNQAEAVMSVTECPYNPYKTHVISDQGILSRFFTNIYDNMPRQNLPSVYVENGAVYLNRISSLLEKKTFMPENKTFPYIMPPSRSLDIDTYWDLQLAEWILRNREEKTHNKS